MKPFILIALFFIPAFACSQNNTIDSLKKVLHTQKEDTNKVNTLITACSAYWTINKDDDAIGFAKKALSLSDKIKFKKGSINAYINMLPVYLDMGNYPDALKVSFSCLKLSEEINDKKLIAHSYQMIGGTNTHQGNNEEALKYFFASLKIQEEVEDTLGIAQSYNSIGECYSTQGNYSEALKKYSLALKIYKELGTRGPYWGLPWSYGIIGNAYIQLGNLASKAGDLNVSAKDYNEAIKNLFSCLKFWQLGGDVGGTAEAYHLLGNVNVCQKKYSEAKKYLDKSLQLATSVKYNSYIPQIYYSLFTLDTIKGNCKQAFEHYRLYISYRDSLSNEETRKKSLKVQMQYEFDKKESAVKAEQDKKDVLTNAEIGKQKVVRNFSVAGAAGILFLGGFVFYNFRKRKKLESQQTLSNERLRISRELHDDIGSTLGSIAVYSDVAKNRSVKNENPVEVLSKIGNASRELIEKMSDIVWSLNPDNETFEQLQNRMQGFAAMILTPRNITIEFKTDDELKTLQLTSEQRKNIFLIYKEAIHNIVKYAECKNVLIELTKSNNTLSLVIKDDGKGFDSDNTVAYNGNGLKNMKARADDIRAELAITSNIHQGTNIELKLSGL